MSEASREVTRLQDKLPHAASAEPVHGIPYRMLGRTGQAVSAIGLGGFHLGQKPDEATAIRLVQTALDAGINFLDNSWDYNDGASENRMGQALQGGYRDKAFLMTKIDSRTRTGAARQLDESLRRLKTDRIDLLQFHEIIRMSDADEIFAPGGALEAVVEARQAGKVRFIGYTGHKSPHIHMHMMESADIHRFQFDTVQCPVNVMDAHYDSFARTVLPAAIQRGIAVLAMKPMGAGKILESGTVTAPECLQFAMSMPVNVVITGCDSPAILEQALEVARSFRRWSRSEMDALLARTELKAGAGQFEAYKTTDEHDSTEKHPQWLA